MAASRAFSTDYNDHMGLLHTFARKGWSRLIASQISVDYEDVVQELSVAFVKAINSYDPSKGYSFTAYAGRAMWNEFNRYAKKQINEATELGTLSIQALDARSDTDEGGDLYEVFDSGAPTPEEQLERKQEIIGNLRKLSPTAKFLVSQMMSPSPELEAALEESNRKVRAGEISGLVRSQVDMRFAGNFHGIPRHRLSKAIDEIKTVYGE